MAFEINSARLVIIDVQEKLAPLMQDKDLLFDNICILAKAAKILEMDIIVCRQYPAGLGKMVEQVRNVVRYIEPIDKLSFSCTGQEEFIDRIRNSGKNQLILCGIEAHVCVYQTAMRLMGMGCQVCVPADAVSSRTEANRKIALGRMQAEGVKISSVEMIIFELLKTAEHPKFKEIARLIK